MPGTATANKIELDDVKLKIEDELMSSKEFIKVSLERGNGTIPPELAAQKIKELDAIKVGLEELIKDKADAKVSHSINLLNAAMRKYQKLLAVYEAGIAIEEARIKARDEAAKKRKALVESHRTEMEKRTIEREVRKEMAKEGEEKIRAKVAEELKNRKK